MPRRRIADISLHYTTDNILGTIGIFKRFAEISTLLACEWRLLPSDIQPTEKEQEIKNKTRMLTI